jgi:hypothetical protein
VCVGGGVTWVWRLCRWGVKLGEEDGFKGCRGMNRLGTVSLGLRGIITFFTRRVQV